MVTNVVGIMRAGHRPTMPIRASTSPKAMGHRKMATPYCAAAQTGWPRVTPAKAGNTLPTTGMNSAGVMPRQKSSADIAGCNQRQMTPTVPSNNPTAPNIHTSSAHRLYPLCATQMVGSKTTDEGKVATNTWRRGWLASSSTAAGNRYQRHSLAPVRTTKTTAANTPTHSDTCKATGPQWGTARNHASDKPHRPMTMANQAKPKYCTDARGARCVIW